MADARITSKPFQLENLMRIAVRSRHRVFIGSEECLYAGAVSWRNPSARHATIKKVWRSSAQTLECRSIPGSLLDAIPQEQHVNHERTSWGRLASIPVSTSARRRRYQLNALRRRPGERRLMTRCLNLNRLPFLALKQPKPGD